MLPEQADEIFDVFASNLTLESLAVYSDRLGGISRLVKHARGELEELREFLRLEESALARSLVLWSFLDANVDALTVRQFDVLESSIGPSISQYEKLLLQAFRAERLAAAGDSSGARELLFEVQRGATSSSIATDMLLVYASIAMSRVHQRSGKQAEALKELDRRAQVHVDEIGDSLHSLLVTSNRGHCCWRLGDFNKALAAHQNPASRDLARRRACFRWLADSHNAAAKNLLELYRWAEAEEELDRGFEEALRVAGPKEIVVGNSYQFRAELFFRFGYLEDCLDAIERALALYERVEHHWCRLDALVTFMQISVSHHKTFPKWGDVIGLVREMKERGFDDLRSRFVRILAESIELTSDGLDQLSRVRSLVEPGLVSSPVDYLGTVLSLRRSSQIVGLEDRYLGETLEHLKSTVSKRYYAKAVRRNRIGERWRFG